MSPPDVRTPGEVGTDGRALREADKGIVGNTDAERKAYASLQARAAIAGFALRRFDGEDGRPVFLVSRWNLTRDLHTLDDVAAWLDRASGVAA